MKNEADFKKLIKKSVTAQGGLYISLACPVLSGIPDAYILMPGYSPILVEAKYMKDLNDTFHRSIHYTAMQKYYLKHCENILTDSCVGLMGVHHKGQYKAIITRSYVTQVTSDDAQIATKFAINFPTRELFDILGIMDYYGMNKLNKSVNMPILDHVQYPSLDRTFGTIYNAE